MNQVSDADRARLARFEQLARIDPANEALLADAVDLALGLHALDVAGRFLESLVRASPHAPQTLFRQGRWALANGMHEEARGAFQTVRARVGPGSGIDSQLAAACAAMGDYEACADLLLPYAQGRSLPLGAWSLLLGALHRAQRLDAGHALVFEQRDAFSSDSASLGAASLLCLDASDVELATTLAARALELDREQLEALVVAGFGALNNGDGVRAVTFFTEATRVRPAEPRAWSGLGFALLYTNERPAATGAFERSVALSPTHAGTWHGLAWSRLALNDLQGAQAAFESALECDRNFAETHGGLALVAHLRGERAVVEQALARAFRLDRRSPTARYVQALTRRTRLDGASRAAVEHILEGLAERDPRLSSHALLALARRDGKALS